MNFMRKYEYRLVTIYDPTSFRDLLALEGRKIGNSQWERLICERSYKDEDAEGIKKVFEEFCTAAEAGQMYTMSDVIVDSFSDANGVYLFLKELYVKTPYNGLHEVKDVYRIYYQQNPTPAVASIFKWRRKPEVEHSLKTIGSGVDFEILKKCFDRYKNNDIFKVVKTCADITPNCCKD